jgi:hypothetical protein
MQDGLVRSFCRTSPGVGHYQPDPLLGRVEGAEAINLSKARQNRSVGYDPGFYREHDNLRQS